MTDDAYVEMVQHAIDVNDEVSVPVDSGCLLVIDPCNLPAQTVRDVLSKGHATIVDTGDGDGLYGAELHIDGEHSIITIKRI